MTNEKFIEVLNKRLKQLEDLHGKSIHSSEFQQWQQSVTDLIINGFGKSSHHYTNFIQHDHSVMTTMETTQQEEAEAFEAGLKQDEASLLSMRDSVEDFGLPVSSVASKQSKQESQLVQNFYISQSQAQVIENDVDFSNLNNETQENLTELLKELKKQDKRDDNKIINIVKWLANNAVNVLIAIIAAKYKNS